MIVNRIYWLKFIRVWCAKQRNMRGNTLIEWGVMLSGICMESLRCNAFNYILSCWEMDESNEAWGTQNVLADNKERGDGCYMSDLRRTWWLLFQETPYVNQLTALTCCDVRRMRSSIHHKLWGLIGDIWRAYVSLGACYSRKIMHQSAVFIT